MTSNPEKMDLVAEQPIVLIVFLLFFLHSFCFTLLFAFRYYFLGEIEDGFFPSEGTNQSLFWVITHFLHKSVFFK